MNMQNLYITVLESNIINFLIMTGVLVLIFKKFKLGRIIDNFANDIQNTVITSSEAVKEAVDDYKQTRKKSRDIGQKKEEIIKNAQNAALKLKEKNKAEIEKKKRELEENGEKLKGVFYERKVHKTADEIQLAVYNLACDTVKDILNDEIQNKTIIDALDELDKIEAAGIK